MSRSILADVNLEEASALYPAIPGGAVSTSAGVREPTAQSYTTSYQEGECAAWYPEAQPLRPLPPPSNPTTLDTGACYSGDLGTAVLGIRALSLDIRAAREDYETYQENYDIAVRGCNITRAGATEADELQRNHNRSMSSLRRARNAMETVALAADAVKGCADAAAASGNAVTSLGIQGAAAAASCGSAVVASGARIASTWIQDAMDEAEQNHQVSLQRVRDNAEYQRCMNDAGMNLTGARAAMTRVERARQELLTAQYQLNEDRGDAEAQFNAGRQALEDLRNRATLPPDTADLRDVAVDQYERALTFAKRALRLAAAAVSYEQQITLPETLERTIRGAQYPWDLENVLNDLRRLAGTRRVLGSPPENRVAVLSLRDDILQLQNRQSLSESEQRLSPAERLRLRLSASSAIVRDADGTVLGRRIPFALAPVGQTGVQSARNIAALAGSGCAERLWHVSASLQLEASTSSPAFFGPAPASVPLMVRRSNAGFFSQWCGERGPQSLAFQEGSTRPSNNPLLLPSAGTLSRVALSFDNRATASTRAFVNVDPRTFASDDYVNGGSSELAGRGLFGQYEVFIPESAIGSATGGAAGLDGGVGPERPGLNLSTLTDIVLRLEYVSIVRPIETLNCVQGTLDCDERVENGCEVTPARDPENCGGCGVRCPAGVACVSGVCDVRSCQEGFADCDQMPANGCEVDTRSSAAHCGACGRACPMGRPCVAGVCSAATCEEHRGNCDNNAANGCETNLQTSVMHCGACGQSCMPATNQTAACAASACTRACSGGFLDCDNSAANGCETDPRTSVAHCGACDRSCPARPNATATCAMGTCGLRCNVGFENCDGDAVNGCETDTRTDANHCGSCNTVCPAGQGCAAGACSSMACRAGLGDCNNNRADGCEVTLASNVSHCGVCNNACPARANAVATCSSGACASNCLRGFGDCDNSAANGCEATLASDPNHCGACARRCAVPDPMTQVALCRSSVCEVACRPGRADCNSNRADGCEADLVGDPANCGRCGARCAAGQVCANGACSGSCPSGQSICGGVCRSTTNDSTNCGGCGNVCPARTNATATCVASACGFTCDAGFGNCDAMPVNGCETDTQTSNTHCGACGRACPAGQTCVNGACAVACTLTMCGPACVNTQTDTSHCGACGNVCALANVATNTCAAGACGVGACATGFANCNNTAGDGCEVSTQTDIAHCGGCGMQCALANVATNTCAAGACGVGTCNTGFGNCDNMAANGCETDTRSSNTHCGACDRACPSGQSCQNGMCTATCTLTVCGGACVNTQTDIAHCGGCSRVCALANVTTHTCAAGACGVLACATGFGNCDNMAANGCETNIQTSATHCGACNRACPSGQTCTAGACVPGMFAGDTCAMPLALDLTQPAQTVMGTTAGATSSAEGCAGGADVFYRFTLTRRELVYFDTFGTSFDTQLRLHTNNCGMAVGTCADNACAGNQSQLVQLLDAGTYILVVDGATGASGPFTLRVQHLPAGSGPVGPLASMSGMQTVMATTSGTSGLGTSCGGGGVGPEAVWWLATCPDFLGGAITASTCGGAAFDTVVEQQSAARTPIAVCNDDACGTQSSIAGTLPSGPGLHTVISDGYGAGDGGPVTVSVNLAPSGSCTAPEQLCGGMCVNTRTSTTHCGMCNNACTTGQVCDNGVCGAPSLCGNGVVDAGEQCDDNNRTDGDGCERNCQFICQGSVAVMRGAYRA